MKLLDILLAPWALEPAMLREMQTVYAAHLRGDKIDVDAIEARLNRPLANEQQEYTIRDGGVAVLPIEGVIAPKANLFTRISGGASAQLLTQQVESAIADPRVRALVLAIDSPGGSVFGSPELAAAVRELSSVKPIVAVSDGQMASAAYWIGSAANAVYISGPTVQVGSIGVVATHNFNPRMAEGTTEITAGKYKRIATSNAPLSTEGREYMQAQVDHLYTVFIDAVAAHRDTDADTVLEHMADGRVFIGQQAIDRGLVDGVSTVDAMVEKLASNPAAFSKRRKAQVLVAADIESQGAGDAPQDATTQQDEGNVMPLTKEQIEAEHADIAQAFRAEGAAAERERIQAVEEQVMPGHEALIASMKFDGKSTGGEAALAVLAAEKTERQKQAADLKSDAPAPLPQRPAATVEPVAGPLSRADLDKKAKEYMAAHAGVDYIAAVKHIESTQGA